ncbi:MAG: tetratricopeptide repeat protein [Candidatus Heimdallarchaeota archaeon]|nr:tetratricopeptide repeat protein [Candidatus Heimdallarchaeota archaeon]
MPTSIKEELEKLQQTAVLGGFLTSVSELNIMLERKDLSLKDTLYIKLLKSEVTSFLNIIGLDDYTFEKAINLAEEVVQQIEEIEDEYLRFGAHMILATNYMSGSNFKKSIETYEYIEPLFKKLKPINGIFYLRIKALNYLFKSMLPLLKTYIGENATNEERAKAFQLIQECEKFCEENSLTTYQVSSLNNIAAVQYWMGDLNASLETSMKMVEVARNTGNKLFYAYTLSGLARSYSSLNNYMKYYDLHKERLIIVEELGFQALTARTYQSIGLYHLVIGDYEEALVCYDKSLRIFETLNRKIRIAFVQKDCGYAYFLMGNFEKALEYYDKAFPILDEERPQTWRFILSDLAAVLIQIGDFDQALEYLEQLMPIHTGLNDQHGISLVLSDQGMIYWQKGMKEKGLDLIERSLEIRRKIGDRAREAASLSYLIRFQVELGNVDKAKEYFESLDQINNEIDNKHVNQNHKFSEALLLKESNSQRDRIKAELLFEQLIEEEAIYPVLVQILLNLCELLLTDLKDTSNPDSLDRINNYVDMLQEISTKNKSHFLLVETLGLKAQLALMELDIETAKNLLLKAQTIAQKNGLDESVLSILKQQEELTKQSIELKKLDLSKTSISSRMTVLKLENTVDNIKKGSLTKTVSRDETNKKLLSIQI